MIDVTGSLQIRNKIYQAVLSYKENNKWKTKWISTKIKAVKGRRLEIPVVIACYYGLRRSEVLGLRWSAINFESKVITINHVILDVSENGVKKIIKRDTPKTKSSIRTLPLVPFMEEYFKEVKKKQEENKKLCKSSYGKEYLDYVCVDDLGNIITLEYVSHQFTKMLKTNKLRKIRFHDLRHTCASILLDGGVGMKEIQLWLGHSNFNTTANIYAHLDTRRLAEGADTIATALASE